MNLVEAISKRVQHLLNEKGVNQYYLYKNGGIPRSTISNVVNCRKKKVSTDTIYQICTTLAITLEEFFDNSFFDQVND